VTLNDRSVADVLAMSADVGRGPPPLPPPAVRPRPLSTKPATSGGGGEDSVKAIMSVQGCEAEPCQHGGVCYTDAFSPRGFSCRCADGYFGDLCQYGPYCQPGFAAAGPHFVCCSVATNDIYTV